MNFLHSPLLRVNLERLDSPDGRRYVTPSGNKYESVTTWLSRIEDKSWIDEWKKNVGESVAKKTLDRASKRGTTLHENIEQYLKNKKIEKLSMLDGMLFKPLAKIADEHINNVHALEYPLYSDAMRLAGTVDCVAEYEGVLSLIDFKTSKNRKSKEDITSYFLQTSIYSLMIQEIYGIKIDKLVILMAIDNENKVLVFEESRKNWFNLLVKKLKEFPPK